MYSIYTLFDIVIFLRLLPGPIINVRHCFHVVILLYLNFFPLIITTSTSPIQCFIYPVNSTTYGVQSYLFRAKGPWQSVIICFINTPFYPISLHSIPLGLYFDILEDGIRKMIISIRNQGLFLYKKYKCKYWLYWYHYESHFFTQYSFRAKFWYIRRWNPKND